MGPLIFLVFIAVLLVVIPWTIAQSSKTNAAWQQAANRLGLTLKPAALFSGRSISGRRSGVYVKVDTFTRSSGNNSSTTYTRFRADYPRPLGIGLKLTAEGFFTGVTKFFGAQDVQVGDPQFDQQVLVKATDDEAVRQFLTPARRMRISRFLSSHSKGSVADDSVSWYTVGVIRDHETIQQHVDALCRLAGHLCHEHGDATLNAAMQAEEHVDPRQAYDLLHAAPYTLQSADDSSADQHPYPVEEKLLEGELLYMANRGDEAKVVFEQAHHAAPDDEEIGQWLDYVDAAAPPQRAASVAVAGSAIITPATICEALFSERRNSIDAVRQFEEDFVGQEVTWTGKLTTVQTIRYDFIFRDREGCKATFEVHELDGVAYGSKTVSAVVQFPETHRDVLEGQVGASVTFTATLFKLDGIMHNIFLIDGTLRS